jgi:S1-C subfamily serine protease
MAKAGKKAPAGKKPARPAANKSPRAGGRAAARRPAADPELRDAAGEVRALRAEAAAARAEVRALREGCARLLAELRSRAAAPAGDGGGAPQAHETPPPLPVAAPAETGNRLGATVAPGVVVADVLADSLAAEAGVLRGDVIEAVNDRPVYSGSDLRETIDGVAAGVEVTVRLRRAGNPMDMIAVLGERPGGEDGNRLGVTVAPGVVVAEVLPGGPADEAGIAPGDVVEEIDGREVHSGDQLRAAVLAHPPRSEVVLAMTRAGKARRVTVRLE